MNDKAFRLQLNEQAFLADFRKQRAAAEEWLTLRKEDSAREMMDEIKAVFEWDALVELEKFSTGFPYPEQLSFWDKRDRHVTVAPVQNQVRDGLALMDDTLNRTEAKKEERRKKDMDIARLLASAVETNMTFYQPVSTVTALTDTLALYRARAKGCVGQLSRGLDQHLGGNTSPNLVRVPIDVETGQMDCQALLGTALDPTVQYLMVGDYKLPAPLYVKAYKITPLVLRVSTREHGEVRLEAGLYFDVAPVAVVMDTVSKSEVSPKQAVEAIAKAGISSLALSWEREVIGYHRGWSISAQMHSRIDIPKDVVVITPEHAMYIAEQRRTTFDSVHGSKVNLTGYPLVNSACRPCMTVWVLDEWGLMSHFAVHPGPTDDMGRDNDGDAPTISEVMEDVASTIPELLKRNNND